MGNRSNGNRPPHTGRTVSYLLNNKWVTRGLSEFKDRRTAGQLAVREATRITAAFLKTVKDFIEITFAQGEGNQSGNAWNKASSLFRKQALTGVYPDLKIDFAALSLSKGNLAPVQGLSLKQHDDALEYCWNPENTDPGMSWNDKVMILAYFPEIKKAEFILNGANRNVGRQLFSPLKFKVPKVIETYITFISPNHKIVMDSVYTGSLIW